MIFPSKSEERNKVYNEFIEHANQLWDDFTTGGKQKKVREEKE